ncbi:NADH dehydrogenase (ubiquinone) [Sorangium cellulosum]|uniref:NADH-quinone oxidoreductase subunit A n=1 Tax=Sorangium cellulosum TaxID=56 RepID=A0A2L0FBJ5_SORCE|nr:NADH-quinone oxidoreductase subunit A [Sorangium cellulosum]AUX48975.1 NADH dehydrogenase (ubiquinone) [Sorangium cellulosum]
MLMAYASVAAFFLVAIGFVLGSMLFGKLLRPNNMYAEKVETYECGEAPVGPAWFNFNPRFYIIALIYIVFDVEIAFIYPVAAVFKRWVDQGSGLFAFLEILLFVAILMLGFVYVWVKGDLNWIRSIKGDPRGAQNVTSRTRPRVSPADASADGSAPAVAAERAAVAQGGAAS